MGLTAIPGIAPFSAFARQVVTLLGYQDDCGLWGCTDGSGHISGTNIITGVDIKNIDGLGSPFTYQWLPPGAGKFSLTLKYYYTIGGETGGMGQVVVTVVKIAPYVELYVPTPPNKLYWPLGSKVKVKGKVFYTDPNTMEKAAVDQDISIVYDVNGVRYGPVAVAPKSEFEIEVPMTDFGLIGLSVQALDNGLDFKDSLPAVWAFSVGCEEGKFYNPTTKQCEVLPIVKIAQPAIPTGRTSFQVGDTVTMEGSVTYMAGLTEKNVPDNLMVELFVNGVAATTVIATSGRFTFTLRLDNFGLYAVTAKAQGKPPYADSFPSVPVVLFSNCEPGKIYNPVAGVCEQPLILLFDNVTTEPVKEGTTKVISGTITDALSNPVAKKKVNLEITDYDKYSVKPTELTTDDKGKFTTTVLIPEITGLLPFKAVFVIPSVVGTTQAFVPTPFTVYSNKALAALLIDPVLPTTPKSVVTLTGTLQQLPSGAPIPGAPMSLYDKDGKFTIRVKTDATGRWTFKGVPVGDVAGIITFAYVAFDGLPATATTPRYDASGLYPVAVLVYQPTVFINPNLFSPIYVSTGWMDSGGQVQISGVLMTLGLMDNGSFGFKSAGANEPITMTFSGKDISIPDVTVLTAADGSFTFKTPAIVTKDLLTLLTVKISYTGTTYLKPTPIPAMVLIYKAPFSSGGGDGTGGTGGGGMGGTVGGIPVTSLLAVFGVAVGAVVVGVGVDKARRQK